MTKVSIIFWLEVLFFLFSWVRLTAARQCLGENEPCMKNATCLTNGTKDCRCPPGSVGVLCENNPCSAQPCQNGAQCDPNPINGTYKCKCARGFSGTNCSEDDDECTKGSDLCEHGGTCVNTIGSFKCECQVGYSGQRCEIDISECDSSPCLNGATCNDLIGNYSCLCNIGFEGTHCEQPVNACLSSPCQNGGQCENQIHGFKCKCQLGFKGLTCSENISCACPSHATCSSNISSPKGYTCTCNPGFSGPDCRQETDLKCSCLNGGLCKNSSTGKVLCQCPIRFSGPNCETVGTGATTPQGGSTDPWHDCPDLHCRDLFWNKRCDPACNTALCFFDRFECLSAIQPCRYENYCGDHYGDGSCDKGCDMQECGWDGLDCPGRGPPKLADGILVVEVLLLPDELQKNPFGLLLPLNQALHTTLQIQNNAQGKLMIDPLYGTESNESRSQREPPRMVIGSTVHLVIDNRHCEAVHPTMCFNTTEQAAAFLNAILQEKPQSYKLLSVNAERIPEKVVGPPSLHYLIGMPVGLVFLLMVVLVVRHKRRHGALWLPEGFLITGRQRREPLGQDDMDLKYMQSASRDVMKTGLNKRTSAEVEQGWMHRDIQGEKPMVEDEALLPADRIAGNVDSREWTPQHCRVVDLTLRAHQAELILDCLDMNVRGPDGVTPLMLASVCHGASMECDSQLGDEAETEEEGTGREAEPNIITDLVALGAGLQEKTDGTGETALHLAARYARADATKRLLDAGADANARDRMGRTPLHTAVAADAQGVFQILIRNRATELNAHMNDGTTPLILAARLAVEGMVEQLVHCHIDINAVDDHGKSALHWAAAVNNVEAVLTLVKNGANRDLQDIKEETPLFLAAREGSFDAARVLLDHCCSRDISDHLDQLPRDVAQERMHHDIVQLLDHYNLAPRPEHITSDTSGQGPGALTCASTAQGRKGRRAGCGRASGEEGKAKRRKKPGEGTGPALGPGGRGGPNHQADADGLAGASPNAVSPVHSLESPHARGTSPLLVATPPVRMSCLPAASHVLGCQQQDWLQQAKHCSGPHLCGLHVQGYQARRISILDESCGQLPPVLALQGNTQGGTSNLIVHGQNEALLCPQTGTIHVPVSKGQTFVPSSRMGNLKPLTQSCSFSHSPGEAPPLRSVLCRDNTVDNYPTPPSQHSYITPGLDGVTPGLHVTRSTEHPYLTPSPESPDPWSSSSSPSSHSTSDWSDTTTSPVPLVNSCGTLHSHPSHTPHGVPLPVRQPCLRKHPTGSMQARS